jgi:acetyl-CoA acetyltransferase
MWRASGLTPGDVDVVQLYDGYSLFSYFWLEALGLYPEGQAFEFVQDGRIEIGGELPVNTFGGQLNEGRMHGIGHIAEAVRQAAGRAGARQVRDAQVSVATVGPLTEGSVSMVFTREPT